jgi:hypothetical protein
MDRHTVCALTLSLLAMPVLAQTAAPASAPAAPAVAPAGQAAPDAALAGSAAPAAVAEDAPPAMVVVEGRRPGPGVWKVSKDGHVMWVFGLYSPLPQKMEWDASRVERLVTHSQEVLLPPGSHVEVGFFRGLTLLPTMIGMQKNPDGATLKDIVPADVYPRWQALKAKYLGDDDDIERDRPIFASQLLQQAAMKKNGLTQSAAVRDQIVKIAKRNDVKVTDTSFGIELKDPRGMLKDFKKAQLEDAACFSKTIATLEQDVETARARANAWANGNIADITLLGYAEREQACGDAILNSQVAKNAPEFQNVRARIRASWLQAADKSLANNASTFAVLQMSYIVDPKGYLADLQAKGYTVESPK